MCGSDIFLGLIAIFFPPLAVWVKSGICSADSLINIALCCLGYLPGLIHAWYIISIHPEPDLDDPHYHRASTDPERASITYYYVQQPSSLRAQGSQQSPKVGAQADAGASQRGYDRQGQMGYGTLGNSPAPAQQSSSANADEQGVPPSYQEAIQGDNKVQHD